MGRPIQRPSVLRHTRRQPLSQSRVAAPARIPRKLVLIGYGATVLLLGLVGLLVQDVTVGRILLVLYGITAILAKIPSADTFKMAIIS